MAQIIENAKLDVLAQIAENKGEDITKYQLKTILNKYFENISTLELPDDLSNSDIKLNANQTYGGYKNIALSDIYNGTFSVTNATNPVPDITKHKWKIKVNGEEVGNWIFDKNGKVYSINESGTPELDGRYSIDGKKMTKDGDEFEWDGDKFVITMDDGNGGSIAITLTEMIPETFKFTIDGTEYTAEEGMTWANWVASDYNTGSYYVTDDGDWNVYVENKYVVYDTGDGGIDAPHKEEIINSTRDYHTEGVGEE